MIRLALAALTVLLLAGCGGHETVHQVVAAAPRADLLFGYFGVLGEQLRETAAHCNLVLLAGWGDWTTALGRRAIAERIKAEARQALELGIDRLIVTIDWAIFTPAYAYRGLDEITTFVAELAAAGIWEHVVALYPVDEPELHDLNDATMTQICAELRLRFGKPLAVIFTDHRDYPGVGAFDWAGTDHYGGNVLENDVPALKSRLRGDQRLILVPGGCSPWREPVWRFLQAANADPQVAAILAFRWFDHPVDGPGIRSNGMAPEYIAAGKQVKGAPASA